MLELLGLSRVGEAVYRAMLANPRLDVGALAAETRLTERQVRSALDELADLALLAPVSGDGARRAVVSPEVGLAALLASAEEEAARRQRQIEQTRAAIAAIAAERSAVRSSDEIRRLDGVEAVRARMAELALTATRECMSMNAGAADRPDARAASAPLNQQALDRGVMIRAVCRESFRNDPETLAHAQWLVGLGGQLRTVPTLPMPMVIVDRRIAILPLNPHDAVDGAIEVDTPGVLAASCALFEHVWATGTSFGDTAAAGDDGCLPQERALLGIVADGHTDEYAARKLGVSLRTVRRMMSDLMERLNAQSRFQAGVKAARRGWI
jgi:DNA-binding CsgD family transcriptional regulator/DNA-binding transcriptional regulator GbsR (MarR family)